MFSTANTPQDHRPPRGPIAPPPTAMRLADAAYSGAAALPAVAVISVVRGAFLKLCELSAGEQIAAAGTTMECNGVHR
jgi:hypothetical protein